MKDSRPSLALFIISAGMSLLARFFEWEPVTLIFKPIVLPAIFYYYLQTKTRRTNFWFVAAIWLFFVSDMTMVIFPDGDIVNVMFSTITAYVILLKFALADMDSIRFSWFNTLFLAALIGLLSYLLSAILELRAESIVNHFFMYLAYGIVLIMLVAASTFNYLTMSTNSFMYLCTMALCMLVSDLIYAINMFLFKTQLPILDSINLIAQYMSYFFMVKYFNARRRRLEDAPARS